MTDPDWRLETGRLWLRRLTVDDADLMLAIWNDPAFVQFVGDRGIRDLEQAREAMQSGVFALYRDYGFGPYAMVLKTEGTRIGICGLFKREALEHPDIGFAALPQYCGKGYTGEAAEVVVAHARDDLGIGELTAIVSPGNAASIGLIEKLGLSYSGTITMPGDDEAICLYSMALGKG